jgi:hypothetical protein
VNYDNSGFPNNYSEDFFTDLNFDELWQRLWGDDLNQVYSGGTKPDVIKTHLLGILQTGPL